MADGSDWHIVTTKPQSERKAAREMEAAGLATLVPMRRETIVRRRGRKVVKTERDTPYLRRYMAVQAPGGEILWRALEGSKHAVTPLTMASGQLARLSAAELGRMRAMDTCALIDETAIVSGCRAQVMTGPFSGHTATVDGVGTTHARVTVAIFGRPTVVSLPICDLMRIDP